MTWVDYLVLCGLLALSLAIGVYHSCSGGQQRTTQEYILNNRQMAVLPAVLSFLVSYMSSYSVLGSSAEYYFWGTQFWFAADVLSLVSLLFLERLVVPMVYRLQLTSMYEYFDLRFRFRPIKLLASGLGVTFATTYMGLNIYGPAIALETATGLSMRVSMALLAGVAAIYTFLGGIRAVIWTDVLQFIILVVGLVFILGSGCAEVGGITRAFSIGHQHGRINFASFSPDPRLRITFWNVFTYRCLFTIYRYGFDQAAVQRYTSVSSLKSARHLMWSLMPILLITQALCSLVGVVAFAYFTTLNCDPFQNGTLSSPNQVLPHFMRSHFTGTSGVQGLFLALVFSASLSSISSGLSGCAANTWVDLLKPFLPALTDRQGACVNRILVLVYAMLATCIAVFMATLPGNMFRLIGVSGSAFCGPLLGLYILGTCSRRVEWRGATVGCVASFALTLWISVGSLYVTGMSDPLPPLPTDGCHPPSNTSLNTPLWTPVLHSTVASHVARGTTEPAVGEPAVSPLYTLSFFCLISLSVLVTLLVGTVSSEILHLILKFPRPHVEDRLLLNIQDFLSCEDWSPAYVDKQLSGESGVEACDQATHRLTTDV